MGPNLAYLSGAPRVSTDPESVLGGARTHITGLIGGLRAHGCRVDPMIVGDLVPRGWIRPGGRARRTGNLSLLAADLIRLAIGVAGPRLARNRLGRRVDFVYERMGAFQAWGRTFQRRGIPWILEANAPLSYESTVERDSVLLGDLAQRIEYEAYRRCDGLVTVSEALKDLIVGRVGISEEKVCVVPSAVDPAVFNPDRKSAVRLFEGPTLIYVGWLVHWQGLGLLLQAMALAAREGATWNLVVLGDGPSRDLWTRQSEELGLEGKVRFAGQVSGREVPGYIAGADVGFVGPTRSKIGPMYRSPLKLYEYMAMQVPVVAARYEDALRVVEDGKTGLLFEPEDVGSLAEALGRLYRRRHQLPEMGRAARHEVVANHHWRNRAAQTLEFVTRIMS